MLVGAWGEQAVALLERAAGQAERRIERDGLLAVAGVTGTSAGDWRCWVSGRLTHPPASEFTDPSAIAAHAYAQRGAQACAELSGTFVAVAHDRERRVAGVTRDHLGGRPLVYAQVRDGVVFAEHERDVLALLPSAPGVDRSVLVEWVERGTLARGRTLYAGVKRLPPAHRLVLTPGRVEVERYWLPSFQGTLSGSRAELAEHLRAETFAAVRRAHGESARPALRLSGGLDSACVAAALAPREPATLALAAVFPEHPEVDEHELIEATARHTGLELEQIVPDANASMLAPALEHIARWRVPPATPNLFVWKPVMARARARAVDVMLDGEGGDELFGLAPRLIADKLRAGRFAAAWSLSGRIPEMGEHPNRRVRMRALRVFGVGALIPEQARARRRKLAAARAHSDTSLLRRADAVALAELESSPLRELDGPHWWRGLADELLDGGDSLDAPSHLRRESEDERVDRRHPFLHDVELVRTVLANPPETQFDPHRDRALLRDALAGKIPESVRTRYAKSFFTPLLLEALEREAQPLAERLERADAPIREYVQPEALDRLLRQGVGVGANTAARRVWQLGMADAWLRAQEHPEGPPTLLESLPTLREEPGNQDTP
ncbi:MAG TPA: asparagine synthase-related protein [Solirubrobacteraceae bacterium]|nr:asparagine synthase-related protein [Solirubrobacteraceae bacterium]